MVAPTLLWRYILREILLYTLLGLSVITLLFLTQHLLRFLEETLASGIGLGGLLRITPLILVSYFNYVVPTAVVFGVLLGFGRMSADGEIVAIRASGVSVVRMLPPVLALGGVAALLTGYLLFEVEPQSRHRMKSLLRELAGSARVIEPGRFRTLGENLLYVHERGDESCPLRGVLIGDPTSGRERGTEGRERRARGRRGTYVAARCGAISTEEGGNGIALDLFDGSIHFSENAPPRYRRIRFARMHTVLNLPDGSERGQRPRDFGFAELLELDRRFAAGEAPRLRGGGGRAAVQTQIHRRAAFAGGTLLLALLAVPLGIRPLRTGRSAGALTAVGLIGAYWLLFTVGELVSEKALVPAWLGLWLPNALVAGLLVFALRRTMRSDS